MSGHVEATHRDRSDAERRHPGQAGHGGRTVDAVRAVGALVVLAALISAIVLAFALPALKAAPHDLPIGVAGPAQVTAPMGERLQTAQPGAFEVTTYADEPALRTAITHREVYGGLAITPAGVSVLTASAASPAVATMLATMGQQLAQQLARQQGGSPSTSAPVVTDVVPLPADDPYGVGLATALLPILIGAVASVVIMIRAVRRPLERIAAVLVADLVIGFAVVAILQFALGSLTGTYLFSGLTLSLALAAMSMALLGLYGLIRWAGLALGVLSMLLFGMPLAGVQSAPELLPVGWGTLGQLLPPGAGTTALRSAAYFEGYGAGPAYLVLTCWA